MNHSTDSHPDQRAGITVGTVTYLAWGLLTVYWKQLTGFDAFELIGWRVSLGAITMAIGLTITRRWGNLRPLRTDRALVRNTAAAALLLTVNWTSYVWAVVHGHVLETALGYFIAPIGTVLVGVLVLREPLVAAQRVALALAVAAVLVLSLSYGEVPVIALLLAVSWVVYGYLKKKVPLGPVESMAAESFVLAVPAVAAVALFAPAADSIPNTADSTHLVLVMLAGVVTVAPLLGFAFAAHRVPLTVLGPLQYLVPTVNFLIGWLAYDEPLPGWRLLGFGLVWLGLLVLTLDAARRTRNGPPRGAGRSR